jgi:hypothetical protein
VTADTEYCLRFGSQHISVPRLKDETRMNLSNFSKWPRIMLLVCGLVACTITGCSWQSTIGGQTLPSAYYLRDDIQFFPAGVETRLPNLRRALDEYRLEQESIQDGLQQDAP